MYSSIQSYLRQRQYPRSPCRSPCSDQRQQQSCEKNRKQQQQQRRPTDQLAVTAHIAAAGHAAAVVRVPATAQQSENRRVDGRRAARDVGRGRLPAGQNAGLRVVQQGPDSHKVAAGQQNGAVGARGDRQESRDPTGAVRAQVPAGGAESVARGPAPAPGQNPPDILDPVHRARVHGLLRVRQIRDAVDYLHKEDVSRRDIKCENVLLEDMWHVKPADFGFARMCSDERGRRLMRRTYYGSMWAYRKIRKPTTCGRSVSAQQPPADRG
ncbi:Protein kinase domain,Protein kinase-like domain [Cinara cedri]|uniref:Protein kinase domain,Protein kinase-like domain n=1 Tax=Cinara cedri TaxID=506608 RepID=A0A5E4N9D5_9HEMI|nr:Protein kinase domain,Protein kinase-like domain [Cinara cedri]